MSTSDGPEYYSSSPAEVIIAVDFGTTFSGFAYAKSSVTPIDIRDCHVWPGAAKARAIPRCKNQTSLLYVPRQSDRGKFDLKDWGWSAFNAFSKAVSDHRKTMCRLNENTRSSDSYLRNLISGQFDALNRSNEIVMNAGYFAHKFKLYLAPKDTESQSMRPPPGDLTPDKLIIDYLRCLTQFIMSELQNAIRKDFSMQDVQWCITVPAVWAEDAKQRMKILAEKAGMIKGPHNQSSSSASPRSLNIILEPEAASAYCAEEASQNLKLVPGNKILVADVGGGTIDLVVHEVIEVHHMGGPTKVKEVVASYGQIGGGTYVDSRFFEIVREKIGCFDDYCRDKNPSVFTELHSWWQGVKCEFSGPGYSEDYNLVSSGLSDAWRRYDEGRGITEDEWHYEQLLLTDADFMRIFDPEVNKVLALVEKQIGTATILMVVGGFAGSPYLKSRVMAKFKDRVAQVIVPADPGGAICRGAVALHLKRNYIKSRISKKTYGINIIRHSIEEGDRPDLIFVDDDGHKCCKNVFDVFVRAGDEVEVGSKKTNVRFPSQHGQKSLCFELYTSSHRDPRYIDDVDCKNEGMFVIDISSDMKLDKDREIEITMVFGQSMIEVSAVRLNFGSNKKELGLTVTFEQS